jgi:hypothetical protein
MRIRAVQQHTTSDDILKEVPRPVGTQASALLINEEAATIG